MDFHTLYAALRTRSSCCASPTVRCTSARSPYRRTRTRQSCTTAASHGAGQLLEGPRPVAEREGRSGRLAAHLGGPASGAEAWAADVRVRGAASRVPGASTGGGVLLLEAPPTRRRGGRRPPHGPCRRRPSARTGSTARRTARARAGSPRPPGARWAGRSAGLHPVHLEGVVGVELLTVDGVGFNALRLGFDDQLGPPGCGTTRALKTLPSISLGWADKALRPRPQQAFPVPSLR